MIGNSDRHHSNWGVIPYIKKVNDEKYLKLRLCPLYDNGSSLCAYEDNNHIEVFFKDRMKFEALVNTKSKSALGWETERPIRHFDLLKKLNRELGITIVVITHEMQVIKDICDRVAVMTNGEVVEYGDVFNIFSNPKHKTTKEFVDGT